MCFYIIQTSAAFYNLLELNATVNDSLLSGLGTWWYATLVTVFYYYSMFVVLFSAFFPCLSIFFCTCFGLQKRIVFFVPCLLCMNFQTVIGYTVFKTAPLWSCFTLVCCDVLTCAQGVLTWVVFHHEKTAERHEEVDNNQVQTLATPPSLYVRCPPAMSQRTVRSPSNDDNAKVQREPPSHVQTASCREP